MDDKQRRIIESFDQRERLSAEEPAAAVAFSSSAEKLDGEARRARGLVSEGADVALGQEQREALAGRRFPGLQGVASLFAAALQRSPQIAEDSGVSGDLLGKGVRLDRALGRLAWAGELLWRGGENGAMLTASAAQSLCQGLITKAGALGKSASLTPAQRSAVTTLFTEPNRIEAQRRDREARARDAARKNSAPYEARIGEAEESAARSKIIESFFEEARRRA